MAAPVVSKKTYGLTFLSLICLTALTTGLGFLDLGPFNTLIALLLAAAKASLIGMFFMHAWYESRTIRVVISAGVIWIAILISLTVADYTTRQFLPTPANQTPLSGL